MGALYKEKVKFKPHSKGGLRRAYVTLFLRMIDDILSDDEKPLPGAVLTRLDNLPASDYVEMNLAAFESVPELAYIHKFLGAQEEDAQRRVLKMYECKQEFGDGYQASSIFAAVDKKQVNELYAKEFPWRPLPLLIIEWQGSIAYGEPRLLYSNEE